MINYNPNEPLFSIHIPKTAGTSFENVLRSWFNDRNFPNLNNHPRLYRVLAPWNIDFLLQRFLGCGLYLHYSNEFLKTPPRKVPLGLNYGLIQRKHRPECVHGHFDSTTDKGTLFDYYPMASQFITFLRDPLEMQLSLYFYLKKRIEEGNMYWQGNKVTEMKYGGDIDRWVEERELYFLRSLPMMFDMNNYKDQINKYFIHIGVTERMQTSVDILASKLGQRTHSVLNENVTTRNQKPSESSIKKFREKYALEYLIYDYACSLNN